jgi:hypothetical protein
MRLRNKNCDSSRSHVNWDVDEPTALQVAYRLQCMRTSARTVLQRKPAVRTSERHTPRGRMWARPDETGTPPQQRTNEIKSQADLANETDAFLTGAAAQARSAAA